MAHGRRSAPEPEQLLAAIVAAVDDGFYPASRLAAAFPRLSHRDLVGLRKRALGRGLVLERRDPERGPCLALTSEGWRALREYDPG